MEYCREARVQEPNGRRKERAYREAIVKELKSAGEQ
jgi:hypothetical protein